MVRSESLESNPTPALPLSGEGADCASTKNLPDKETLIQTPAQFKQGVGPSPCQGGGWEGVKIFNESTKTPLRPTLRKNPTEPERLLWNRIRNRQLLDIKFRRQQGIGRYIVDFYSAEYSLVIELDGDSHFTDEGIEYDQVRDEFLWSVGLTILRFTNSDIMQNIDGVLTTIITEIQKAHKIHEEST